MSDPVAVFRRHLHRHEYDSLEEDWLALLEADSPPAEMMDLAELVARNLPGGISVTLLRVLADWFEERKEHRFRLRTLRRLVELGEDGPELATELADCFRSIHCRSEAKPQRHEAEGKEIQAKSQRSKAKSQNRQTDGGEPQRHRDGQGVTGTGPEQQELLERVLQQAGLGFGAGLREALAAVDGYVKLLPGTVVVDDEFGPARVKSLDLLLNRAVLADRDGREHTLELAAAVSRTRPAEPGGFFELLLTDPDGLAARARTEPGRAVREMLQDLRRPMTVQAIRKQLSEVVSESDWDGFWNRARRELDADPHLRSVARPSRGYEWSDSPVEHKSGRAATGGSHSREVPVERLARMSRSEIVKEYLGRKGFAGRRQLIEQVEASRPDDAREILADFFCAGNDNRARKLIEERFRASEDPGLWPKLSARVLTSYRQVPEAFAWVAANAGRLPGVEPAAVLTRVLDLVESPDFRRVLPALRKALVADDYRLVASALDSLAPEAAPRLLERLGRVQGLEPFRRDEITALIHERFPDLEPATAEDVVFTTEAGYGRAREELENLTGKELPRAAEELAAARAHGDLSENYEYKAAKEKQARLMSQVRRLQSSLARTRVIRAEDVDTDRVSVGCRVRLEDGDGRVSEYTLLGPWDSNPDQGIISYLAPLSGAMLGRRSGESFEYDRRYYTVRKIVRADF